MNSDFPDYLQETDVKTLARIDEILARSRKVVEESMELSKKTIDHKIKIIDTPTSEKSLIFTKDINTNLETSSEKANECMQDTEKSLEVLNSKIKNMQNKALQDEMKIEILKERISAEKLNKTNPDIEELDKIIEGLKETLNAGLAQENKKLKVELETVLKRKSAEEMRLTKELDEVIRERKVLENQYRNLKYLYDNSPNYIEELQEAKLTLERLEQQSIDTIKLLEIRIQEQENENFKLKAALQNPSPEALHIIKVRFEDQARQNLNFLSKLNNP